MVPLFLLVFCEIRPLPAQPVNQEVGGSNPPAPVGEEVALRLANDPVALHLQSGAGFAPDHPHLGPHLAPERVGDSG